MNRFLLFISALATLTACTQGEIDDVYNDVADAPQTITVGFDSYSSRVELQEGKSVWTKGDLVSVFNRSTANEKWAFQGETGERSGELALVEGKSTEQTTDYITVVYPYSDNNRIDPLTHSVVATIPALQHYHKDSYGVGESLMVAHSTNTGSLQLKSVCGWLRISLTGSGKKIKAVKLRGNNGEQLAGEITLDAASAAITSAEGSISKEITLDCGTGVTLGTVPTTFYFALFPQTFERGITVDVVCEGYLCNVLTTDNSITIERNHILPMESVEHNAADMLNPLESLLSSSLIFSSRQLYYTGTVMQCFDFYGTGADDYIYFTQCVSDSTTGNKWLVALSRVKRGNYGDTTRSSDTMSLRWFGHGTLLCIEQATDGGEDYVWIGSNGTLSGKEYTNNNTFSRFRFKANTTHEHSAGENFYLASYKDSAGATWSVYDIQPNIDFTNRRLLIGCRSSDRRHLIVYDLDQVLALSKSSVSLTLTYGGESGTETTQKTETRTITARNLEELTPLGSFRLKSYLNSGNYTKTYSCNHQGHAIWGDYIYWYEGNALESTSGSGVYDASHAYIEVFDYSGKRIAPRTKVAAASDFTNMKSLLNLNSNCYCEAEGMQVKGGNKVYLGITTHIAGKTSGNRRSTILEYDCRTE